MTLALRGFVASPARAASPTPQLAAIVPGLLAHGLGPALQGRRETARGLFLLEGASLLVAITGVTVLARTGASQYTVGPAALVSAAGVTTFGTTLLTGLYATYAPKEGFGRARGRLPLLETRFGALQIIDPQFSHSRFLRTSVDAYHAGWHLGARGDFAPGQANQRWQARLGRRLWGVIDQRRQSDGSYLELSLGHTEHRYDSEGFQFRTTEMLAEGRLDTLRYLSDVRGAFLQGAVGYARQRIAFESPSVGREAATSLLLMHMGFGMYFGNRTPNQAGGEVELYYDHRHDGLVGGLKMTGIGSGALGHFGARGKLQVSPAWGFELSTEAGAAWAWGLDLVLTTGGL